MTVFGVAPPGTELAAHRTVYGRLGYPRFFYGPQKPLGWRTFPLSQRAPGDVPVISVKTWDEAAFRALVAGASAPEWWFTYHHEPEDEITAGSLTVDALTTVYRRAREILDAAPSSGGNLLLVCNWYQLWVRGFDAGRFDPILELVDAVGVDSYSLAADAAVNIYTPPGDLFGPAVDIAERAGIPWAVPEFAVKMAADGDGRRHARVVARHAQWLEHHDAAWVSWWCNTAGNYVPHLCSDPLYADSFDVVVGLSALEMALRHFGHDAAFGKGPGAAGEALLEMYPN